MPNNQLSKGIVQAYRFVATGGGFKIGSKNLNGFLTGTVSVNPPSILTGAAGSVAVTITGVAATDIVVLEPPTDLEAGLCVKGHVVTADTVTIYFANHTAGTVDGAAKNWKYKIVQVS